MLSETEDHGNLFCILNTSPRPGLGDAGTLFFFPFFLKFLSLKKKKKFILHLLLLLFLWFFFFKLLFLKLADVTHALYYYHTINVRIS